MSSDSNSKRSSGSSRKKSRKKSSKRKSTLDTLKSKSELRPVVTDKDGKTNLVALVLGMVTSMVLLFGIFSDRVENKGYDAKQQMRNEQLRKEKKADSLEELLIKLTELGTKKNATFTIATDTCRKRIAISKEILSRGPADENMRQRAVCEGILAHVKLYGLDFTEDMRIENIGETLESAYKPYLDDDNPEVYENARVALLTHLSFEHIKAGRDDVSELVDLFSDTINRFPQSEFVASMIEAHLFVLIERDSRYANKLFSKLREKNPAGALDDAMETGMRNVADRLLLQAENFNHKYSDRWANGVAGRRELVKTSDRLLNQRGGGLLLLRRLSKLSEWFERNEFFEEAKAIYDGFSAAADQGNIVADHRAVAKRLGLAGLKRIGLNGQTISYRGVDEAGKQLDDAELKAKVVIVLFWSIRSEESIRYLVELNATANSFGNKPVSILAVCVDEELATVAKQMRKSPLVRIVEPNFLSGKNSLIEQCPPGNLPHVMLVAPGGVVADVNADPLQIESEAVQILRNRNRE
jgi:hypothetical protein